MLIKANDSTTLTQIQFYGDAVITLRNLGDKIEVTYVKDDQKTVSYLKQGTKKPGVFLNNKIEY